MRLFEHTAVMPHSVDDVFALTVDLEKAPYWHSFFTNVGQLTPDPIGLGSRWQLNFRGGGFALEIIKYQPPERVAFIGSRIMGIVPNFTIEFETVEGGAQVHYLLHPDVPALLTPVLTLLGPPYGRRDLNRYFRELDAMLTG